MPTALLEADSAARLVDDLGAALADAYGTVEAQLQAEVARRVYKHLDVPDSMLERLRTIRELETYSAQMLGRIDPEILAAQIIQTAASLGLSAAAATLAVSKVLPSGGPLVPTAIDAVMALQLDLQNKLTDMHNKILRWAPDAYRDLTAQYVPQVLLGANTLRQTQGQLVEAFFAKGITGFVDSRGRPWRIGTYAEMVTRSSTVRAWTDAGVAQMQRNGINTVTPIGSGSPCHLCRPWQHKTLSTDGTPAGVYMVESAIEDRRVAVYIDATLEEARAQGLQHPNCRDVMVAALPGVPIPQMAPNGFTLSQRPEDAVNEAKLRRLEVAVRDAKRMEALAGSASSAQSYKRARLDGQAAIRAHVAATGVPRRNYREQLHFADGARVTKARQFYNAFEANVPKEFSAFVNHYSPAEITGMKAVHLTNGGKTGLLVHDHGDGRVEMTGLFNGSGVKGGIAPLINKSILEDGVNYAECYGDHLKETYARYGFKVVERYDFDPTMAAADWNTEKFDSPPYYILKRE